MFKPTLFALLLSFAYVSAHSQALNTLSATEKKDGWKLLFDGKDFKGWHAYGGKQVGTAWIIEQGAIKLNVPERAGNKAQNGGDIVTDEVVTGDFEFKAEWKVSKYANSGIFFFVTEAAKYPNMHTTGLELQVIDDKIYEGAKENTHRASDFFGIANARLREGNPEGEWNKIHFIVKKGKLTVYQNEFMVQEHDLKSADWKQKVANSGLKAAPISKGSYDGRIGLQDWGSTVWYRNIKLRKL
ncbi:3-keto-disaccharide hydrolase [Dyadobacter chenhuakuii]|uniref:DUF1080 domain-containing protein n=1 Tax=Dyadobacter chenhuakuii TaxID=2909339 RepID=A0ABY4XQZ9_9BACT|nr:DUF1080 domain-containing protein [Dyadobacter chenhuakuii]MCF2493166.1 DUF1080 domain-containing protein [Dyadobacter chenhuakuii]USJ32550.1 DUF1080 domain-containing protein [Dyadobacter chenhuakuii]